MKKNIFLFMLLSLIAVVFISGTMDKEGSPGEKSGSLLDGIMCARCHPSSVTPVEWISSNISVTGYMPGQIYTIAINATDATATKIGFEVTAENASEKPKKKRKMTEAWRRALARAGHGQPGDPGRGLRRRVPPG